MFIVENKLNDAFALKTAIFKAQHLSNPDFQESCEGSQIYSTEEKLPYLLHLILNMFD